VSFCPGGHLLPATATNKKQATAAYAVLYCGFTVEHAAALFVMVEAVTQFVATIPDTLVVLSYLYHFKPPNINAELLENRVCDFFPMLPLFKTGSFLISSGIKDGKRSPKNAEI
jgi:hypothetical protein